MKRTRLLTGLAAVVVAAGICSPQAAAADNGTSSTSPWWDPTAVIESPVNPARAEGTFDSVSFTDATDGDHEVALMDTSGPGPLDGRKQPRGLLVAEASGYTPGQYYTVRVRLHEADSGTPKGTYTWLTYRATDDGRLHIRLPLTLPTSLQAGDRVVGVPTVYNANDVRRDGRPNKVDENCVLQCERVAPLTAWTDYQDPGAIITMTAPATD